jgi:hypothetical protein
MPLSRNVSRGSPGLSQQLLKETPTETIPGQRCLECGETLTGRFKWFCTDKCRLRNWRSLRREHNGLKIWIGERQRRRLAEYLQQFGSRNRHVVLSARYLMGDTGRQAWLDKLRSGECQFLTGQDIRQLGRHFPRVLEVLGLTDP